MNRRAFIKMAGSCALAASFVPAAEAPKTRKPNLIIFFVDDMGYNDVGCYGSANKTPNFDRMAAEGMRFTSFYAQAVCGPSRAALMTGCYPIRVGEPGNTKGQHTILHTKEVTLPEILKTAGYTTGMVGKWHIAGGRRQSYPRELMPLGQGFDTYFGTPLHNGFTRTVDGSKYRAQLMRGNEITDQSVDQDEMNNLTKRYTEEVVRFIGDNRDKSFFLYLAHNMPHVPLGASDSFRGSTGRGLYADVIRELDWSMGQVLDAVRKAGIDRHTLVVFTSDNGPWVERHLADKDGKDPYYGSARPLRGSKMMTWDGGERVPGIVWGPGFVPAGRTSAEIVTTLDILPTFAKLSGARAPDDRIIDGMDLSGLVTGADKESPRDTFYFYCYTHLQAVRHGKWKLVLPRPARPRWCGWSARMVDEVKTLELYDLEQDLGETRNLADEKPEVVKQLMALVEKGRRDLGDYDRVGEGARFHDEGPKRPDMKTGKSKPGKKNIEGAAGGAVYDNAEPVGNLRFTFEEVDPAGWVVVDGKLPAPVSCEEKFYKNWPINSQGRGVLNTLGRAKDCKGDDKLMGVIESPVFQLKGDLMSFLVGGGGGEAYVALCDIEDNRELMKASGDGHWKMKRINWDISAFRGKKVVVRIVDNSRAGWGHLTFDDFSTEGEIDREATTSRRKLPAALSPVSGTRL